MSGKKSDHPTAWSVDTELTIAEAARLLAEYDTRSGDTTRDAIKRTRIRIERAIEKGNLKYTKNSKLRMGELIAWARQQRKWRGKFRDLPADSVPVVITGSSTLPAICAQRRQTGSGTLVIIPSSIEELIEEKRKDLETKIALHAKIKELQETIEAKEAKEQKNKKKGKRTTF